MNDQSDVRGQASELIAQALLEGRLLGGLDQGLHPADWSEAYAIQHGVVKRLGGYSAWKVGAPSPAPEAERHYSALPSQLVEASPAELPFARFSYPTLEAEVAFKLGQDLPPRDQQYTAAEVRDAVASVHAVIEVVDSRFAGWPEGVDALTQLADLQNNGFLVVGEGCSDWQRLALETLAVRLSVDSSVVAQARGGNPAGDPFPLLLWLANELPTKGQSLSAGDIVTCGTCTGKYVAAGPLQVEASFEELGQAHLRLI